MFECVPRTSGFNSNWLFIYHMSGVTMDDNNLNVSNVKVAVRVRPMNRRGESKSHPALRDISEVITHRGAGGLLLACQGHPTPISLDL